jgi:hypothetical protein
MPLPCRLKTLPCRAIVKYRKGRKEIVMYAVEFDASVTNGVITIPLEYRNSIKEDVRVILLSKKETKSPRTKNPIYSVGIDMTGYKFDREELHER